MQCSESFALYSPECIELDFTHMGKRDRYAYHHNPQEEVIYVPTPTDPMMIRFFASFAPLSSKRLWQRLQVLLRCV